MAENNIILPWDEMLKNGYEDIFKPSFVLVWQTLKEVVSIPCYTLLIWTKYIKTKFLKKLDEKLNWIPEEDRISIIPELWIPLLRDLSYYSNDVLANMFIELLTKSANKKTVNDVLPSYIKIIENLSEDEALILEHIYDKFKSWNNVNLFNIPSISLSKKIKEWEKKWGFITYYNHLSELNLIEKLNSRQNMNIYIENLISLWVLYIPIWISINNEESYKNLEFTLRKNFPQYFNKIQSELLDSEELWLDKWLIELTWLWASFLKAIHE